MHPEFEGTATGDLMKFVEKMDMTQAWCKGCQDWRPINASFAKYCQGEIESCSQCRK
jgi:hypothetical protein